MATPSESLIALCTQRHLKQAFNAHFSLIFSDPPLISHLLKACVEPDHRSIPVARQLHSIIITGGFSNIKFVSNHLINAYVKLGSLETALKVFNKMGQRNSATWNAVITGMIKYEFNNEGLRLFKVMRADGFLSDAYTLGSILRACAGLKDLIKGKQVHSYAVRSGLELNSVVGSSTAHMYMRCGSLTEGELVIKQMPVRNIVAFNTLIAGRVQNGCPTGALDLYRTLKVTGLRPDKITFTSVITSCSALSTLGQGQQIHAEVVKNGSTSVAAVISSLISMYSRCGCLDDAVKIFKEKKEVENDLVLWSSMISAYGFHGKGKEATDLFKQMEFTGIEANEVTFLSLLYACSHCGLKDEGLEFFDLMVKKYKLKPETKHYTCIVDLLGRTGRLDEAEGLIRSMPVEPDAITWKTLLSACRIHKNAGMAKRIAEEIIKIDPLDSASYVLLSNAQASAKRWEGVLEIRKKMRDRMVKKEPGVSWFELRNEVHRFAMGDKSHPRSDEIESYLNDLTAEIRSRGYVPDIGVFLHDMDLEENEYNLVRHSEKLAVAFALMNTPEGVPIRIMKNLRVCDDCHVAMKYISLVRNREIIVRDSSRFHHFRNGDCSCGDFW
ncbi:pentatricopeptide repeat-containing protein at2g41080 [Phtheirospermum japonicum]|uniref:Pentatricopeptide repeat-containing protein at2g41080 n=1 Tax=Phtheirospermum japonicum TaxID=374723 RepID=A0A830BM15_9LAMI|nr:pentatricopeptide repeat-containing protein at2g41080 [Phtheirospermum japonicum]